VDAGVNSVGAFKGKRENGGGDYLDHATDLARRSWGGNWGKGIEKSCLAIKHEGNVKKGWEKMRLRDLRRGG